MNMHRADFCLLATRLVAASLALWSLASQAAVRADADREVGHLQELLAGDPKWWQPPDLTPEGFDVEAMSRHPHLLADDFLCTNRTAITNIVIWGSWLYDELPQQQGIVSATNVAFTLSFHSDVTAGVQAPWSMPGQVLWWTNFTPGTFTARIEKSGITEGWYNPATSNWMPNADWTCWRYEFPIDPAWAFVQTGTVVNPIIYWLDLQATPLDETGLARFGWKTTPWNQRWNDDACWAPAWDPYNGFWWDLHYPAPHPRAPDSFDLAFALYGGPEAEVELLDFGDAPDFGPGNGTGDYNTLLADNGARHVITSGGPWLGFVAPDGEMDGQPTLPADGDDFNPLPGPDDEDGVLLPAAPLVIGNPATLSLSIFSSMGGWVDAWIDWNQNGVWGDLPVEQVFSGFLTPGFWPLVVAPPPGIALTGTTYARFRISSQGGLAPTGLASDGEVEDYELHVVEGDWGDAPDSPTTPGYPTLGVNNGACHAVVPGVFLGASVDTEGDGQPTVPADGDDRNPLAGPDDEDGVVFTSRLISGQLASCVVTASTAGQLAAWLDGNADGDWDDTGEQVIGASIPAGATALAFHVPSVVAPGPVASYMRFRFSTQPTFGVRGLMPDGEVEDYLVTIDPYDEAEARDYGDAPDPGYPTLSINNGAAHLYDSRYYLGARWDAEPDGQPTAGADGDDNVNLDDEDGLTLLTPLMRGSNAVARVRVSGGGFVSTWVDFDQDGSWAGSGEQVLANVSVTGGVNDLTYAVPMAAAIGPTFARLRFTTIPGVIGYQGLLTNGEVEDYAVTVYQPVVPGSLAITNFIATQMVARVWWRASNDTLTAVQICSNLVSNVNVWVDAMVPSLTRDYTDSGGLATTRFYRVYAPYSNP